MSQLTVGYRKNVKIPCPICQTNLRYMLKSMDGIDYYRCENCNEEFRVKIEKIKKGE